MYYFPMANVTFESPLTDEEIASRINRNLEKEKMRYDHWLLKPEKNRTFEGVLFNNRFRMKRVEYHSSLCNTVMTGVIKQQVYNKSTVTLKFRITGINGAVLFTLLLVTTLIGVIGAANLIKDGQVQGFSLGCIGLGIAAYGLILWRFNTILNKNLRDLAALFEAQPSEFAGAESKY
jgi:hypothetical protein